MATFSASTVRRKVPWMQLLLGAMAVLVLTSGFSAPAVADETTTTTDGDLGSEIDSSGPTCGDMDCLAATVNKAVDFLSIGVIILAAPYGIIGVARWMMAGGNVEQADNGRTQIRNSLLAVGAVVGIQAAVAVIARLMGYGFIYS